MYSEVRKRADRLVDSCTPDAFAERQIGLEKESLRVSARGSISQLDHPEALGRALTHPFVTTDFSEALLEMVTPPCDSAEQALHYLTAIHQFIVERLPDGEHIWNTSMPCILRGAESVRIGHYGTSHSGRMKHAYRRGLGLRYGRRMQAIAGVHFNYSMPESAWTIRRQLENDQPRVSGCTDQWHALSQQDQQQLRTEGYFQMMQNLLRVGWIVPYLFGASPAICHSFLGEGEGEELSVLNEATRYAPYGTSLRMGNIGYRYREDHPIDLSVRHTQIDEYIEDIISHVSTEHLPYKELGLLDENNCYQQLSTSRLQIENEYYSSVRPKQIARSGELPIHALRERGIRYLELRSVDVNVLKPEGLDIEQIAMLEMLMIFAWLTPASPMTDEQVRASTQNVNTVAHRGREPGLRLLGPEGEISLCHWGEQILDAMVPVARWLDETRSEPIYVSSLDKQKEKFADPERTPSAEMLKGVKQTGSYFEYTQLLSKQHHEHFLGMPIDQKLNKTLGDLATESIAKQSAMESDSKGRFKDFLDAYLNQIHPESTDV